VKKITALVFAILIGFTSISFAMDLNSTVDYLDRQKLDEWGILALYSNGCDVEGKTLYRVDNSNITTDYEAYILGAVPLGRDVSDYARKIINAQRTDGKFADYIDGSGEDLVNTHIWGVISLYAANENTYDKVKALNWFKDNQNEDGGFPIFTGDLNSDLDLTAMGIIAYNILGLDTNSEEVKNALNFIESNLDKRESSETVAWYILARIKLGLNIDLELYNKLLEYRLKDGSFKHLKSMSKGNYMATWHSLLAISDYNKKVSIFTRLHKLNRFSDLKGTDYAYKEIMELVNREIVSGYPDGTFMLKGLSLPNSWYMVLIFKMKFLVRQMSSVT